MVYEEVFNSDQLQKVIDETGTYEGDYAKFNVSAILYYSDLCKIKSFFLLIFKK